MLPFYIFLKGTNHYLRTQPGMGKETQEYKRQSDWKCLLSTLLSLVSCCYSLHLMSKNQLCLAWLSYFSPLT